MFIQNVSYTNFQDGFHRNPGDNSIAIQILSPRRDDFGPVGGIVPWPTSPYNYKEVYQFLFDDIIHESQENDEDDLKALSEDQAKQIVDILYNAYNNEMNVIVHCAAGICRSGAVVEAGIVIGFEDTRTFRSPNILVKKKLFANIKTKS